MKVAALMPIKIDFGKSCISSAVSDAKGVSDDVILLWDNPLAFNEGSDPGITENIMVRSIDESWNDWVNRATLLARAAKYKCDWAMWLDDDEELGPSLTYARIHELCEDADAKGFVCVDVLVRTAWDELHWRCDGRWATQRKLFLQKNPLMLQNPNFESTPNHYLHHFPSLVGERLRPAGDYIIHFGLYTPELRRKNAEKYKRMDPTQQFSPIPYDYVLDETGLKLKKL
jgi:hypothetical protein